ncbi:MAG: choice-of-anchor J domain-containing protein [Bacteroidales bacterium]|nr:choice-of-anchor J domain-containing protein [Bacteroidales bacterium]MDD3913393.1 choice-of-anchor J domain-containing protein [Bacteroidales bacterium]MDD4633188.1 choice-of-anchor J domain-containing protein [Bacteroidales bacterium]
MRKILFFLSIACLIPIFTHAQNSVTGNVAGAGQKNLTVETITASEINPDFSSAKPSSVVYENNTKDGWLTWAGESVYHLFTMGAVQAGIYSRFEAADLAAYAGQNLTQIRFNPYSHSSLPTELTSCNVRVYVGGSYNGTTFTPGTLVANQVVTNVTLSATNVVTLDTPVAITGTEEIWFGVFYDVVQGYVFSASLTEQATCIEGKSNIINYYSAGGTTYDFWATSSTMFTTAYYYNWWIAGYTESEPIVCDPLTALPYTQSFEDGYPTECWTMIYGDGSGASNPMSHSSLYAYEGTYSFRFSSYNSTSDYNQYLISPEIADGATDLNVSFYHRAASSSEYLKVGYSMTGTDLEDFTWGDQFNSINGTWSLYESAIPDGAKYVAIHYYANFMYYTYVDAFTLSGSISSGADCNDYTVGEGTTGTYSLPVNTFYKYSYTQQLYLGDEIASGSGDINSLAVQYFYATAQTKDPVSIYLCNTDKAEFASTSDWVPFADLTLVYEGPIEFVNTDPNYWVTVTFDTPFAYDGSNLVVVFMNNNGAYTTSSNNTFYVNSDLENCSLRTQKDGSNPYTPANLPTTGTRVSIRNNMNFEVCTVAVDCSRPTNLTIVGFTETTATISWEQSGSVESWNVELLEEGQEQGEGVIIPVTENPYTITGLNDGTYYSVGVQAVCDPTTSSTWSSYKNFVTKCFGYTAYPFVEGFENGGLPVCWEQEYVNGNHSWIVRTNASNPSAPYSGTYNAAYVHATTGTVTKLVMPKFDLSSANEAVLSFHHAQVVWGGDQDELRVYYKNAIDGEWNLLAEYTESISSWTLETINLPNLTSTYWIAFEGLDDYGYGVVLDEIMVRTPIYTIVSGTVTHAGSGSPVANATISFDGAYMDYTTTSDNLGVYALEMETGEYVVTASAEGYNSTTIENFTAVEPITRLDIQITAPTFVVAPTELVVRTDYMVNGHAAVTLTNNGDGPVDWDLNVDYTDGDFDAPIINNVYPNNNIYAAGVEAAPTITEYKGEVQARAAWDLVATFTATAGGMQGVATDGEYIYLTSWQSSPTAGHSFEKYDLDLNFVEGFNITGASQIRDLTYDGTYFYGGSGSNLYCLDLANKTLISTTSTAVSTIRHCSYDTENDGFWVGNWTDLYLINRAGAVVTTGAAPSSAYGSGYDNVTEGGPYLLLFCQPNSNALVYRYNIAANVIESTPIFDFAATPGYDASISGGAFVGEYDGKVCFFGNLQQAPNLIGIYELAVLNTGWLSAETTSGTLQPGETYVLHFTMDGSWAEEGTFYADVTFSTEPNVGSPVVDVTFIIGPTPCAMPENLTAELLNEHIHENLNDVALAWTLDFTPGGGGGPQGEVLNETFETGAIPTGWTNIDADGDGYLWNPVYGQGIFVGHNGECISSASYINGVGALTPDNWLVTPQLTISGGNVTYWINAQDASYAYEHYGVYISTTGINPSDFTLLFEETLTSKNGVKYPASERGMHEQGAWYERTVDLTAYSGTIYIAFRHFNCTDAFWLNLDDVVVYSAGDKAFVGVNETLLGFNVYRDGLLITPAPITTYSYVDYDLDWESNHCYAVEALYSDGCISNTTDQVCIDIPADPCTTFDVPYAEGFENAGYIPMCWSQETVAGDMPWQFVTTTISSYPAAAYEGEYFALFPDKTGATASTKLVSPQFTLGSYEQVALTFNIYQKDWWGDQTTISVYYKNAVDGEWNLISAFNNSIQEWTEEFLLLPDLTDTYWIAFEGTADFGYGAAIDNIAIDQYCNPPLDVAATVSAREVTVTWTPNPYVNNNNGDVVDNIANPVIDENADIDPSAITTSESPKAAWDLLKAFTATAGGMQAVATDGNFIYLASWQTSPAAGHRFEKYTMRCEYVEGFDVDGVTAAVRDLTYDGTYFYCGSGSSLVCIDLANKTLISTVSTGAGTIRHCTYDPEYDGFWVGNWATLYRIDRAGNVLFTAPTPTSAYGSGYDNETEGGPYLLLFCQTNGVDVYQYDIHNNTLNGVIANLGVTPGYSGGTAGGAFVGKYNGKLAFYGNMQQSPNLIGIYELVAPPYYFNIYRNGELIGNSNGTFYTDVNVQNGDYTYCVEAVYNFGCTSAQVCTDVTVLYFDPPTDLQFTTEFNVQEIGISWTAPTQEDLIGYNLYKDGTLLAANLTDVTYTDTEVEFVTEYCYSVTALYTYGEEIVESDPLQGCIVSPCYVYEYSFFEGVENGVPACWETVSEDGVYWTIDQGAWYGNPSAAAVGNYNFTVGGSTGVSSLITPVINLEEATRIPVLSFYHVQRTWGGDQDELRVYYSTVYDDTDEETWTLLAEYTDNISDWTMATIVLPESSDRFRIKFEATLGWGYGVGVDEVSITNMPEAECGHPIKNLDYELVNQDVILNWDAPYGQEMRYHGGEFGSYAIENQGLTDIWMGVRFQAEDMAMFPNMELSRVAFVPTSANINYEVIVYEAAADGPENNDYTATPLYSTTIYNVTPNEYNYFVLPTTHIIDNTKDLIIAVKAINCTDETLLWYTTDAAVNGYSNLLSTDGTNYNSVMLENLITPVNWAITGFVDFDETGDFDLANLKPQAVDGMNVIDLGFASPKLEIVPEATVYGYSVYRNGAYMGIVRETTFTDLNVDFGNYQYCVEAVYELADGSVCTAAPVCVDVQICKPIFDLTIANDADLHEIYLTWNVEEEENVAYYNVFREGTGFVGSTINKHYTESYINFGYYTYCVSAVYTDGCESAAVCASLNICGDPVTNLLAVQGTVDVKTTELTWTAPDGDTPYTGFRIFRDGVEIGLNIPTDLDYTDYDEALEFGVDYIYSVTPIYDGCEEAADATITLVILPPEYVNVITTDNNHVVIINWTAPAQEGVTGYNIYNNGELYAVMTTPVTAYETELDFGDYTFCVSAIYSGEFESATTCAAPYTVENNSSCNPVENLAYTVDNCNVTLTWNAPSVIYDNEIESYTVYRNDDFVAEITTNMFVDYSLPEGIYEYCILVNYADVTNCNNPIACVGDVRIVLPAVTGLTAMAYNNYIELEWNEAEDAIGYSLYIAGDFVAQIPENFFALTVPEEGSYQFDVAAVYASGCESEKLSTFAVVDVAEVASVDAELQSDNNTVDIEWTAPEDETNLVSYVLFRNDELISILDNTVTSTTDVPGVPGTMLYCVKAYYEAGVMSESVCDGVVLEYNNMYPPVTNLYKEGADNLTVELAWTGNDRADAYKVYAGNEPAVIVGDESYIYKFAAETNSYEFGVSALYAGVESEISNITVNNIIVNAVTVFEANVNLEAVELSWEKPSDIYNDLSGYAIYRNDELITSVAAAEEQYVDYPPIGIDYTYCIKALYGANNVESTATCIDNVNPQFCMAPTGLTATVIGTNQIALEWTAPANLIDPVYNVYRQGILIAENIAEEYYVDTETLASGYYTYSVTTVCAATEAGESDATTYSIPVVASIDEIEAANLSIYPNPANSYVQIEGVEIDKVTVYNTNGQLIEVIDYEGQTSVNITVSGFASGVYFFEVTTMGGAKLNNRVVVKK